MPPPIMHHHHHQKKEQICYFIQNNVHLCVKCLKIWIGNFIYIYKKIKVPYMMQGKTII